MASTPARGDEPEPHQALEEIVVTATRSPTLIGNSALHIEAVPAEEIEENSTVRPGNLTSLLKELPGIRNEASAGGLGGTGLQLRGMPTRDVVVLEDGLPLLGIEPDAFGLMQTAPIDLQRVEVIKGAASALYGGSALAGVLNLVSRPPTAESAVVANATSRGGQDLTGFFTANGASRWSGTLTVGAHHQSREDVNADGWIDIPGYRRFTFRPRLWWQDGNGDSTFITTGLVSERRTGGTAEGATLADGVPFTEEQTTRRWDGGIVSHWALDDGRQFSIRTSVTSTHTDFRFGDQLTPSTETSGSAEGNWTGTKHGHSWVLGLAFQGSYLNAPTVPGIGHSYNIPAAFAQDEYAYTDWMTLAASARLDYATPVGTLASGRASVLFHRAPGRWSLRASMGNGFSMPTPLIEEAQSTGLGSVLPLGRLQAERATTASLDAKWKAGDWDINISAFTSGIRNALVALPVTGDRWQIVNAHGVRRAPGFEALVGYVAGPLHALASWSRIQATEPTPMGGRQDVALVPSETLSLDGIFEFEGRGRFGMEMDYTGRQAVDYDPYRQVTPGIVTFNALGEVQFGRFSVFLNAINLTNVRQTRIDPLLRQGRGPGGNPITDVWAPLDGRVINLGVRAEL